MAHEEVANFLAQVAKVQNVSSGGFRVTLDLPSTSWEAALRLMRLADMPGELLRLKATSADIEELRIEQEEAESVQQAQDTAEDMRTQD